MSVRNGICYDHSRSEVRRSRSQDHIFINSFFLREKLVYADESSASAWRRPWSIHGQVLRVELLPQTRKSRFCLTKQQRDRPVRGTDFQQNLNSCTALQLLGINLRHFCFSHHTQFAIGLKMGGAIEISVTVTLKLQQTANSNSRKRHSNKRVRSYKYKDIKIAKLTQN